MLFEMFTERLVRHRVLETDETADAGDMPAISMGRLVAAAIVVLIVALGLFRPWAR